MRYGYKKTTYERKVNGRVTHKETKYEPTGATLGLIVGFGMIVCFLRYCWWLILLGLIIWLCYKLFK